MLAQPPRPVRNSPATRTRRHAVCIFPSRVQVRESTKSTMLPYYHSPQASPLIESPPAPFPQSLGPLPLPPMYSQDSTSSAGSTPQATYAETDSDVSSICEFDFPNPPGMPAVRRMQSSPLFTVEETDAVRDFLRRRWAKSTPHQQPVLGHERHSDFSWNAESPNCNAASPEFEQLAQAGEALMNAAVVTSRRETPITGTPVRVLRRATSMATPLSPTLETAPPLPQSRSLRFQNIPPPSLATAGRQKPRHRPNLSMPVTGMGLPPSNSSPAALGHSFTHRPALSQPINTFPPVADPRSFIDLSPDRQGEQSAGQKASRKRVTRLLARAKSTLIEWSKGLAGKKEGH